MIVFYRLHVLNIFFLIHRGIVEIMSMLTNAQDVNFEVLFSKLLITERVNSKLLETRAQIHEKD